MAINLSGMFQNLGGATDALSKSIMGPALPEDPMQRNAMQRAGVTNPLLQQFGQGLGTAMGRDMGSPNEQLKAAMKGVNPSDPRALLAMAEKIKDIDPASAAKLIQAYQTNQASLASKNSASYSGNDRFKDAKGNYYWATQQRTAQGPKMLLMDINGNVVDPASVKGLQRVNTEGLTPGDLARIDEQKISRENDWKYYGALMDQITASRSKDYSLNEMEKLLEREDFDLGIVDRTWQDIVGNSSYAEFESLAGRLGLDVVAGTTFGALSEGELALAMATAMPEFRNKTDALAWVRRKRKAESKLRSEMLTASRMLQQGVSQAKVLEELEKRNKQTAESDPTNVVRYTRSRWEELKRELGMTDQEMKDYVESQGMTAVVEE